jgi:putative NADH-flavin reductase
VEQALAAGHYVTAIVRDPARLPQSDHPRLEPVIADALDPDAIEGVLAGQDAVISALGPRPGGGCVCSDGARAIITAMRITEIRRLVVVTASGHIVDEGDGLASKFVVKPLLRRFLREGFADFARTDELVRTSGLDWTIMRPPRLTDGARRTYRTAIDRNVRGGITIARADLADATLAALTDPAIIALSLLTATALLLVCTVGYLTFLRPADHPPAAACATPGRRPRRRSEHRDQPQTRRLQRRHQKDRHPNPDRLPPRTPAEKAQPDAVRLQRPAGLHRRGPALPARPQLGRDRPRGRP